MIIGQIKELWRYPVKSLGGESCEQLELEVRGAVGDRHWAVYDPQAPVIRNAKQWPKLLSLKASYLQEPSAEDRGENVRPVRLSNAAGDYCDSTDPEACIAWLQEQIEQDARLMPRAPESEREFYRLAHPRTAEEIARELGMSADEELPDFSSGYDDLVTLYEHATPPGYLYDAYPLHMVTTDSLSYIAERSKLNTDVRRFRPNILLENSEPNPALTEQQWIGATLAVGDVVLRIHSPTMRCSMPGRAQPGFDLAAQMTLPRAIARHADRVLGVNIHILQTGTLRVGDEVRLLEES